MPFYINLGLLLFLFILYFIRINAEGSHLSLNLQFVPIETNYINSNSQTLYKFQITTSGIILLLIISQISSFYIYAKRISCNKGKNSD